MGQTLLGAIIVTFHPELVSLKSLLSRIRPEVGGVVVVDNGSPPDVETWLQTEHLGRSLAYIKLGENLGIAAAHNRGIEWVRTNGFSHVLLLDQDSIPSDEMIERLVACHKRLESRGAANVASVGPRFRDSVTGESSSFTQYGPVKYKDIYCSSESGQHVPVAFLIASGALISLEAFNAVGPMDESLFVDLVDTEWFLRAESKGYQAFGACDAVMSHSLGQRQISFWLAGWRAVPYHPPLRHYYYFRNSILLFRRKYVNTHWRRNQFVELVYMFFLFGLTSPPRVRQVSMMLRGVIDGLKGKTGKYEGLD